MNNKGFMMAEVVVVSAVVLVVLTSLYTSYVKIYGIFKERVTYYDTTTLYRLGYIRDGLIDKGEIYNYINSVNKVNEITDSVLKDSNERVFWLKLNNKKIDDALINNVVSKTINKTYENYIRYLSTSTEFKTNDVILLETCANTDKCNYAYLEIYS